MRLLLLSSFCISLSEEEFSSSVSLRLKEKSALRLDTLIVQYCKTEYQYSHKISEISMGMSADFETAIKFGSTQVRIGSFITASESKN